MSDFKLISLEFQTNQINSSDYLTTEKQTTTIQNLLDQGYRVFYEYKVGSNIQIEIHHGKSFIRVSLDKGGKLWKEGFSVNFNPINSGGE